MTPSFGRGVPNGAEGPLQGEQPGKRCQGSVDQVERGESVGRHAGIFQDLPAPARLQGGFLEQP
jgi:hypothetical protein